MAAERSQCRGIVRAEDLLRHWQDWDAEVAAALPLLGRVPQPLWHFVADDEVLPLVRTGVCPSRRQYRCDKTTMLSGEERPTRKGTLAADFSDGLLKP